MTSEPKASWFGSEMRRCLLVFVLVNLICQSLG
jgi:hypothetical protein